MGEEKQILTSYSVIHYTDGTVEVKNNDGAGQVQLSDEDIYTDIEDTARIIHDQRITNRVYSAAIRAVGDFFKSAAASKESKEPSEE